MYSQKKIAIGDFDLDGNIGSWYDSLIGFDNTELQIGKLRIASKDAASSYPFYKTNVWTNGSLTYRDQAYAGVPIIYDAENDILMIRQFESGRHTHYPIELIQKQISRFTFNDHQFVYLTESTTGLLKGFYDLIYDREDLQLYVKRVKSPEIIYNGEKAYLEKNFYFIAQRGNWIPVYRVSKLSKTFPNSKEVIKGFVKKNDLKIVTESNENKLIELLKLCK